MGQGILGNIRVCPGLSISEPGACLQTAGAGATEWQDLARNTYARVWSGGIKTGYTGVLERWIGNRENGLVEDG